MSQPERSEADVRIRPVDELDIEDIAAIDERIGGEYRPEVWERRVFYYIRRNPEASLVAEVDGRVVGFMLGEIRSGEFGLEEPTGWIEVLAVHPDHRGRAIGRRLAETMLERFESEGATEVRTLVDREMPRIERFFNALGFKQAPVKALKLDLDDDERERPES